MSPAVPHPFDRHALRDAALAFLSSRALLWLVGVLTVQAIDPNLEAVHGGGLANLFCRWDCGWYTDLVRGGYAYGNLDGQSNLAFFPLFPLLARAVAAVTPMDELAAGLFVANACFFVALCYVHAYARLLGSSDRAATLALMLLAFVPHSFVFSAAYTESTYLLLLVAAMYHLRRGHFLVAALAAAALSATRATGVFFIVFAIAWIVRVHG
ncbi:MAG TPA: mannosyltransferase family protein, partial [Xanthomonadales bacterium]|nr:mannosyltransferase family protein [Xanthomonadales bacterium]